MDRLKKHLKRNGITQQAFAEQIGVTQPTVWEWLNGRSKPSAKKLVLISRVTGLSIDKLLEAA